MSINQWNPRNPHDLLSGLTPACAILHTHTTLSGVRALLFSCDVLSKRQEAAWPPRPPPENENQSSPGRHQEPAWTLRSDLRVLNPSPQPLRCSSRASGRQAHGSPGDRGPGGARAVSTDASSRNGAQGSTGPAARSPPRTCWTQDAQLPLMLGTEQHGVL